MPTRLDGWREGWRPAPAQLVHGPFTEHAQANVPGGGRGAGVASMHPQYLWRLYVLHARAWRPIAGAIARRPARRAQLRPCGHRRGAGVYLRFS